MAYCVTKTSTIIIKNAYIITYYSRMPYTTQRPVPDWTWFIYLFAEMFVLRFPAQTHLHDIHTYIHTHTHAYIHTYIHIYTHTYTEIFVFFCDLITRPIVWYKTSDIIRILCNAHTGRVFRSRGPSPPRETDTDVVVGIYNNNMYARAICRRD